MTTKSTKLHALILSLALAVLSSPAAFAYSCEAEFALALALVKEAKILATKDTDARILSMIAEAEGIAEAGILSHRKASERHTGDKGKYMHGDSVRKGKWSQSLAKQAIFLISGKVKR